jgi:hypothetical protein
VRIRDRYEGDETVTCVISGYHRAGEQLIADEMVVDDEKLSFEYRGCVRLWLDVRYTGEVAKPPERAGVT